MNSSPHSSNNIEAKIQNAIYFLRLVGVGMPLVQCSQRLKCLDRESVVTLSWQSEHSEN